MLRKLRAQPNRHGGHTRLVLLCDLLQALGDAGAWVASNLVAPIVTGIFVGVALRGAAIASEVSRHDLRAEEIATDLSRWVRDRGRVLTAEIFRAINLARQGIIEDVAQPPLPPGLEGTTPGDMSSSGAFQSRVGRIMFQALQEYRDEASSKVREYRAMARDEGRLHRWLRRWRHDDPPTQLVLSSANRKTLESWRERTIPTYGEPTITIEEKNDPTRAEDASDIRPLEENGLTWESAARWPAAIPCSASRRRAAPRSNSSRRWGRRSESGPRHD